MYQLQDPSTTSYRTNRPFLDKEIEEEGPAKDRQCTDVICLALFLLFVAAFAGLLIYAIVDGTPKQAIAVHNAQGFACYKQSGFTFGYFPIPGQTSNAMCVSKCPKNNQTVSCKPDGQYCPANGSYTAPNNYSTFSILQYCVPDPEVGGRTITSYFDYNIVVQWIFNIQDGYLIVIGSAIAAIIIALVYSCLLRCLTGCIIYISLVLIQIVLIGIGILLILQAAGVNFTHQLPINIANLSQTELYIAGGALIAFAFIFLVVILCICSKIQLGVKVVQTAAMFLSQRFYMAIMPVISTVFFFATIAALLVGGVYIYGTGNRTLGVRSAFYTVDFTVALIVIFAVFAFAGFWMICWIFYSNTFIVMSSASIWYYQQDSPLCTSFGRLVRYHSGTLAFTSLVFGLLFLLRLLAKFFHLRNEESQNKCVNVCIQCTTFCLCIFDQLLKFLSQGVFVQVAMKGTNYCISTIEAFNLLVSNPLKISITGVISYMIAILGVLFTMAIVCTAAYFVQVQVKYFADILADPIPMTVISGFVVAVVSGVYLSILADSAEAIIQCYLIDETDSRARGGKAKFAPQHLKLLMEDHMA